MEVPGPGVKLEAQLQSIPWPWQHWISATSTTYAAIYNKHQIFNLLHEARTEATTSQKLCQVLNLLSHNRNCILVLFLR